MIPMPEKKTLPEWISTQDAAKHFGVSTSKIRNTIRENNLDKHRDTLDERVWVVKLADLQRIYGRK